jgi:O-antigen/teichoic acid export membrane protein
LVSQVAFPSFSKLQKDDAKLRNAYLKMTHYLSILIFPALVGLAITAPWLIPTVFGEEWQPAVILVQLMCVAGALKGVATPVIAVINGKGYPAISFFWNLLVLSIATLLMLFLARYGVIGIALATTIITLINFPLIQAVAGRLIGLKRGDYLAALRPAIAVSATVGGVVGLVTYLLQTSNMLSNNLAILFIQICVGVVTWLVTLLGSDRRSVHELVALFWLSLRGAPVQQ